MDAKPPRMIETDDDPFSDLEGAEVDDLIL